MTDQASNTTQEQRPKAEGGITGKGFVKGDPRINRKGRPKSFDKLRELAVSLANEAAKDASGNPVEFEGHTATQIEMLLRVMMRENPARFVEIAFGKVPDQVENLNVNLSELSEEQLERLARGGNIRSIITSKGVGGTGTKAETPTNSDADTV